MSWEIQGQFLVLSMRPVIVTTVCTFLRHITQNRLSALKVCTRFSSRWTHNVLQEKLQLLNLVSSPPNELGNTRPMSSIEYQAIYGDNTLNIYTSNLLKTAFWQSKFVLDSVVDGPAMPCRKYYSFQIQLVLHLMSWESQGQCPVLSTRPVIVTTVCKFLRHVTQTAFWHSKFVLGSVVDGPTMPCRKSYSY